MRTSGLHCIHPSIHPKKCKRAHPTESTGQGDSGLTLRRGPLGPLPTGSCWPAHVHRDIPEDVQQGASDTQKGS